MYHHSEVIVMLIGDVCQRTGLTRKAIRYYVDQRLIAPAALPNGYLDFDEAAVERLTQINVLRLSLIHI